ncbi:MAG TPA: amino acid permease [Candidatus Dormibacteraeota bacterium]|jgi:APA family basic amino acid/polyamine antiporter|nr:amino acid permease [Candidatus Dormibacteraeota bacterium]
MDSGPAVPVTEPAKSGSQSTADQPTLVRGLSLLDSVLLLVSGIIGSSIFLTAKDIAGPLPQPMLFLLVWVIGGVISLFGCVAFAELGSMFPESGGQYIYLREAYGDLTAFLYGWMLFAVANGGSIAALTVAAAAYTGHVFPLVSEAHVVIMIAGIAITRAQVFALLLIALVTYVNVVGLRWGTLLQNLSTWTKFAAMAAFVILGFAIGKGDWSHFQSHGVGLTMGLHPTQLISVMGVALIAVFWAYDGWVYITWVAGEVKEPRRNVPLAMVLGVLVVGAIYLAMNMTYLYALPLGEIAQHETIAHAAAAALFSPRAAGWLSLLIAVSCFSAAATCTLSGARVYLAMAQDGVFFKRMAVIHPKWRTPAFSLIGQGIWAALLTLSGRYDQLYTYVIYGMVLSYTLTVIGMFLLRWKRPEFPRPYRCAGYPWLPAIYVLVGVAWTLNTIVTRPIQAFWGTAIVLIGVPGYLYWKHSNPKAVTQS